MGTDGSGISFNQDTEYQATALADISSGNKTITVYVNWAPITYQIVYNGNGATAGSMSNSTHTYDAAKALTANSYSRTGYTFTGWNTKADGTGTTYADKASVKNLSSAKDAKVTLYAQWSANPVPPTEYNLPFTDVPKGHPYYNEIADVYNRGLMTGMTATTFGPDITLNRAFLAAVLYRRAGNPVMYYDGRFPDVKAGDWFASSVMWASISGNIYGYANGYFGPTDYLTREQLCTILWRAAETMDGYNNTARASLSGYPDGASVSEYAKDGVQWCMATGVFVDRNGKLAAWSPATRAELAVMMSRYLKVVGK